MTNQQIIDRVAIHLLKQNKRAGIRDKRFEPTGVQCQYRSSDGSKCAVGCLIPDDKYDPEIENTPASVLGYDGLSKLGIELEDPNGMSFVSELQTIHDCRDVFSWRFCLTQLARKYRLQVNF